MDSSKMFSPLPFYSIAILLLISSKVTESFGELIIIRDPPTGNDASVNLTCVSEDDGAALVWNYNYNINEASNGLNISTDFEPKKPAPKSPKECALWNSTKCLGRWKSSKHWNLVDSTVRPMAPVFDYRWEEFREILSDRSRFEDKHECKYVKQLKEPSGTVVFSVRGSKDVHIFLCQFEDTEKGPCFWVILGKWNGKRSEILNCPHGILEDGLCFDVAKVTHENAIIEGYEWRTFRLDWSTERKIIKIFQNSDSNPFLEATIDQWHDMSHLSVGSNMRSRIRFHFYDYLLTNRKNAVLSTTKFVQSDKHLCIELLVGLCPDCRLNVSLMNRGADIPIKSISGLENTGCNGLMSWQSVRITTTLLDSKLTKLNIVTILSKDGVQGGWAIDSFRTCEPISGLRKSTIPINRMRMTSTTSLWPGVKCQKLSYTGSTIVNSPLINIYPNLGAIFKSNFVLILGCKNAQLYVLLGKPLGGVTADANRPTVNMDESSKAIGDGAVGRHLMFKRDTEAKNLKDKEQMEFEETVSEKAGASLLDRKVYRRYRRGADEPELKQYELAHDKSTVSLRLQKLNFEYNDVDTYTVRLLTDDSGASNPYGIIKNYTLAHDKLKCKLWDNAICFENVVLPPIYPKHIDHITIEVTGYKNGESLSGKADKKQEGWRCPYQHDYDKRRSSLPASLSITFPSPGVVKVKWKHPLLPYTKIKSFQIQLNITSSSLITSPQVQNLTINYPGVPEKEEYETELQIYPSSTYKIDVSATNQFGLGTPMKQEFPTPSGIAFAPDFKSADISSMTRNGTWIEEVPAVINATVDTWVTVTLEGNLKCKKNAPSDSPSSDQTIRKICVVDTFKVNDSAPWPFNISENGTRCSEYTCYLEPGYRYTVKAEAKDTSKAEAKDTSKPAVFTRSFKIYRSGSDGSNGEASDMNNTEGKPNLGWLAIFPIIAIAVILFLVWRRKQQKSLSGTSQEEITPIQKSVNSRSTSSVGRSSPPANMSAPDVVPRNPYSLPVPIDQFEEHTQEALASGLLQAQYKMISEYPKKPSGYGSSQENVTKNRYKDLIAYDHSRVKLQKIPGDDYSDYINANYIKGYNKDKAYIATQGPKPNTIIDFWRMIWQEEVTVICMLANVQEGRKIKCEKYWPDVETEGVKYGDIKVLNTTHEVFADYTVRTFHVNRNKETRTITHLHYTGWPDHGVPMYTQSLVSYIQKLREMKTPGRPVVVHCSAGVGRTGTIILCDISLTLADEKKFVDPLATTVKMREDRANMVDTAQQYLLAHLTIVECMITEETQIPCTAALPKMINELKDRLKSDMKRLDEIVWQERALHEIAGPRRPAEDGTVEQCDDESFTSGTQWNRINAVSVDGVKKKKQYLAARLPSASTFADFWKLIAEHRIELVVVLQCPDPEDPNFCDIVSSESTFVPAPNIEVETKSDPVMEKYFSVKKLSLTNASEESELLQPVTVLTCNDWACQRNEEPPIPGALVSLWIASEKISRIESPTLVICRDGVTGCGLYLALSFLLERMAVETECDVISAVRAVRRSQPDFVKSMDQFKYLYEAATNYHECFKTYGNMA